jgi:AcrR family transcriptional regulator
MATVDQRSDTGPDASGANPSRNQVNPPRGDADPAESRRARKRERTRAELLGAARSLIAERGVAGLRVSDVTERTDVALGSFYSHFETKDEIVEAVVADAITALADAILDLGDQLDDPAEGMSVGVRQLVGLCRTEPELARLLIALEDAESRFEQMISPRARRIMDRGVASGRFAAGPGELLLTLAIAGVLSGIRAVMEGRAGAEAEHECATALLCLVGIPVAEAREIAWRALPRPRGA